MPFDGQQVDDFNPLAQLQFKLVYDGNGRVTDFEDYSSGTGSIDRKWRFAYDGSSNLATMILPDVGATTRTMLFSYASERLTDVNAPREATASGSAGQKDTSRRGSRSCLSRATITSRSIKRNASRPG